MRIKEKDLPLSQGVFDATCDVQLKRTASRIALVLLLEMGLFAAVAVLLGFVEEIFAELPHTTVTYMLGELLYGALYFLCFFIPAWVFCKKAKREGEYRKHFALGGLPRTLPLIVLAVLAINLVAAYVNSYVLTSVFPGLNGMLSGSDTATATWYEILMSLVTVAFVPAVCEEILFRGVIVTHLLPYGRTVALLGSGFLFGLMHGNPMQFFYTSLLGVILAYVYVKTRSLGVCMVLHFINNAISVLQSALYGYSPLARSIGIGIELCMIVGGVISIALLLRQRKQGARPEDVGCFGVLHEPHADFAEYPVTKQKRARLFFSPAMIVYAVLSVLSMALLMLTSTLDYFLM